MKNDELLKVMITEDIIDASANICKEITLEGKSAEYEVGQRCMVALAVLVATQGEQEVDVSDNSIEFYRGDVSLDYATRKAIEAFDNWRVFDGEKPEPFCLYINPQEMFASQDRDNAIRGDEYGIEDEEEWAI